MLTTLIFCAIIFAAVWCLWLLARAFFSGFSLMIAALTGALRRPRITGETPWHHNQELRAQIVAAQPARDDFQRLTREATAYATRPYVSVLHHVSCWPEDPILVRTTADPFGKRSYVENTRLIAGEIVHVVCLYLDRAETPAEVGSVGFPMEQANVGVLRARIEDIVHAGVFLSFRDSAGRIRETRLPKEVKHHA